MAIKDGKIVAVGSNLKTPAGVEIISKLIKEADVFIINFPPHVRKALGLTYEDVSRLNDKIIYADLTGYGDKGPEADKPGFDETAYWARSGFIDFARTAGTPPVFSIGGSGDHPAASVLYGGIVTALYRREMIEDISDTGARIALECDGDIPEEFTLQLTPEGRYAAAVASCGASD